MSAQSTHKFQSGWNGDCSICGVMEMHHDIKPQTTTKDDAMEKQWQPAHTSLEIEMTNTPGESIYLVIPQTQEAIVRIHAHYPHLAPMLAAAPQMLEALKAMLEAYAPKRDESDRVHLHSSVRMAIDAIAAATR